MVSVGDAVRERVIEKKSSTGSLSNEERGVPHLSGDAEANLNEVTMLSLNKNEPSWLSRNHSLVRQLMLFALAALILGWWISATALHATRHRWIVQTFFAWSFIAIIAFRFIPNSVVTRPVGAVWNPLVKKPFFALPKYIRYGLGWLALLAIVLGSAFGFKLENVRFLLSLTFVLCNLFSAGGGQLSYLNPFTDSPLAVTGYEIR
jgi:CNT family concentrative nucleoside transporter